MRKTNNDSRKLEIGEEVIYRKEKTQVISFIPSWNKYLLAGFGSPVNLQDIQVVKKSLKKNNNKTLKS